MSDVFSGSNTLSGTFSTPGGIEVDGELFLVDATVNASSLAIEPSATVATIDSVLLPGGSTTINAAVTNDGVLEFAGANLGDQLVLAGSVSGTGSIELFQNGPVATGGITVEGAVSQGQQVIFEPDNYLGSGYAERLALGDGPGFAGTISGFAAAAGRLFGQYVGDEVIVVNAPGTSITGSRYVGDANGGVLTLGDGPAAVDSLAFSGDYTLASFSVASEGTTVTITAAPCFAEGTRLLTPEGERAVEALREGQRLVLAAGGTAAIVWIGHRRVDCSRHPEPGSVWPVRVRAHAFGADLPSRDVVLSPEHALFLDGALVPVGVLVDGERIVQEAWDQVTYYHVELASHEVVLAEGLAVESYLDTGNRHGFANAPLVALPEEFPQGRAPIVLDGPVVESARARLRAA